MTYAKKSAGDSQENQQPRATCARPIMGEWPSDAIPEDEARYRAEVRQHLGDVTRGPEFHRSLLIARAKMNQACPEANGKIDWATATLAIKDSKNAALPGHVLERIKQQVIHGQAIMELLRLWGRESGGLVITKQRLVLLESLGLLLGRDWYLAKEKRV